MFNNSSFSRVRLVLNRRIVKIAAVLQRFSDYMILLILRLLFPDYTILAILQLLFNESDSSDCTIPPILRFLFYDPPIFPIIRFFRFLQLCFTILRQKREATNTLNTMYIPRSRSVRPQTR